MSTRLRKRVPRLLLVGLIGLVGLATVAAVINAPVVTTRAPGNLATAALDSPLAVGPSISPSTSPTPGVTASPAPQPTVPAALAEGAVPILYLHRVEAVPAAWSTWTATERRKFLAYDVLPAAFAAQLDWLQTNGYTTILPRDLDAHWTHGTRLPPRPVIISLDDGFPSWTRTVLPMLTARGMVAEFYLTLDAIAERTISWAEVRALSAAGMGIGAHDVHHVQLAMLGPGKLPASPATMWFEVHEARLIIGREIGTPPDSMAYVGGGYNSELIALVRRAGYTTARSIVRGILQDPNDRFTLRVIAIAAHDDVVDPFSEELVPGLPTFTAKMAGTRT